MADVSPLTIQYLALLKRHLPELAFRQARLLPASGQFNHVLSLDERWIFRFPKSVHVAADLAHELEILPRLAGRLPLSIPAPTFWAEDDDTGRALFMGYAMLPGEPLLRERYARLQGDAGVVGRIADDLAGFLRTLHRIPSVDLGLEPTADDARAAWARYYADIRERLYPYMRADARCDVGRDFDMALNDEALWQYESCLIHGDFGTGNILIQDGCVSGIIDFSFCAIGDPAQDLGALLASYGDEFVERTLAHYPALRAHLPRARFYRGNYALLQALFALRDGDRAEFEDGIAGYR